MSTKFQGGDRVFAKIKGWPPWPAKILNRAEGKAETYLIQFYGTYDTSVVKPDCIFVYNDDTRAKYGKPKNSNRWKEAMEEIENNIPIGDGGPIMDEEEEPEVVEADPDTDGDGELMIDEGPSQPPVLTKEVSKPAAVKEPSNVNGKAAEQPKGRRGSKASLSKRDSISSTSSTTEVTTPSANAPPATEMVSRSGRKIKPKRFADDEIASPVTAIGKAAAALSSQEEEGPPTKRAKRAPKTPPAAKTPPTPVEPKEPERPTRPRMVIGKGKGAPPKPQTAGRLSPDISSPIPKAPALKPATPAAPAAQRRSETGTKKALPALIPAATPVTPQPVAAPAATPPTRRAPTLRQQPAKPQPQPEIVTDEEESLNEAPPVLAMNSEEVEADDKENVKDSAASSNDSEMDSESEMEKNSEIDETSSRYSEMEGMEDTKIAFADKEGELFELRIETKQEFETEEDRIEYENTIGAVEKIKEDLEQGDADTHETLQELLDANKEDYDPEDAANRERRAIQIRLLRMEGEVIEIIGEIVSCLSEKQAECYRALELLDRLGSHDLTPLILKKHPEVVQTVGKLRNYVGNVDKWDMTYEQTLEFKESAALIRVKASEIYANFYNIFIPIEEQDQSVPFEEIFREEMKVFNEMVQDLTVDEVLGLTAENVDGGFEMFETSECET